MANNMEPKIVSLYEYILSKKDVQDSEDPQSIAIRAVAIDLFGPLDDDNLIVYSNVIATRLNQYYGQLGIPNTVH